MRRNAYVQTLILSAVTMTVIAACTNHPYGIFASIERERAILDERQLGNELTVGAIDRASNRYFIAAGGLWYRDVDPADYDGDNPTQWVRIDPPGADTDNYVSTSLVVANFGSGERVYAVFSTGSDSGVYEIDPAAATPTPSEIFGSGDDSGSVDQVQKVFVVDDGLDVWMVVAVLGSAGANDYSLYASNDGTTFAEIAGTESSVDPTLMTSYVDVITTGAPNNDVLYVTSKSIVVDEDGVNAGAAPSAPVTAGKASGADFRGALYDGTRAWLADDSGFLYSNPDDGIPSGSWTRTAESHKLDPDANNPVPISFTDLAAVPNGAGTTIVVGTEGYGYRIVGDAATATATNDLIDPDTIDDSNYQASELSSAVVLTFYVDPNAVTGYPVPTPAGDPFEFLDGNLLFAGTANRGLWRALSHDGPIQWVRE